MHEKLIILPEDRQYAQNRITELERAILDLGEDFNIALRQSNETWHDNAAFDAARDRQSVLAAELQSLRETLRNAQTSVPKAKKGCLAYGNIVEIQTSGKVQKYRLGGDWSPLAGTTVDGAMVISAKSPIGKTLFGAKIGQILTIPPKNQTATIISITVQA